MRIRQTAPTLKGTAVAQQARQDVHARGRALSGRVILALEQRLAERNTLAGGWQIRRMTCVPQNICNLAVVLELGHVPVKLEQSNGPH